MRFLKQTEHSLQAAAAAALAPSPEGSLRALCSGLGLGFGALLWWGWTGSQRERPLDASLFPSSGLFRSEFGSPLRFRIILIPLHKQTQLEKQDLLGSGLGPFQRRAGRRQAGSRPKSLPSRCPLHTSLLGTPDCFFWEKTGSL